MEDKRADWSGAMIGGTSVAVLVAIVVLVIVALVAGIAFAAIQYYLGSVRAEAAIFLGVVVGGITGVYAARGACDAIIKIYSPKSVFVVLAILASLGMLAEVFANGLSWQSPSRVAQMVAIIWTSWIVFWRIDI